MNLKEEITVGAYIFSTREDALLARKEQEKILTKTAKIPYNYKWKLRAF